MVGIYSTKPERHDHSAAVKDLDQETHLVFDDSNWFASCWGS